MAAALSKREKKAVLAVVNMLKALTHRGVDAHGVATSTSVKLTDSIEKIIIEKEDSSVALGHNLSRVLLRDNPQPVQGKGFTLVFEGRLFPAPKVSEVDEVLQRLKSNPHKNAGSVIEELDGSYTFAIACPNKVIAGRDTMGTNPLYYGENETTCAVASRRKALWTLGIKNARSFPPGNLAVINARGFSFKPVKTITQPPLRPLDMEAAARLLRDLLLQSTRERVADVEEVAVAFSGGLDSSVIAMLAKLCESNVHLVWVGLENQSEIRYAEAAASALGLPLHLETHTSGDVKEVLPKVLWLIEEPNFLKIGVAIPFYWTAKAASKLGCIVLLAGQGSDELFGGYHRYLRKYAQEGIAAVRDAMYRDVAWSYDVNFQRDHQVCSPYRVELRLPFADQEVVRFSLGLPVDLKIESGKDRLRKRVLRRVAQMLGMPSLIVNRPKKAIQYATGVDKALRKLARYKGLPPREYVGRAFKEVYAEALGAKRRNRP